MVLTANEKNVLRFLASHPTDFCSINSLAKVCGLSPNGLYKIVVKFEKIGVLRSQKIANIVRYALEFEQEMTRRLLALAFLPERFKGRLGQRVEDLDGLRSLTKVVIIFGSYLTTKEKPNDIDILVVVQKKNFEKYKKALFEAQERTPVPIHDVLQLSSDLVENIRKRDAVVQKAVWKGVVLWGYDELVEVMRNAAR